MFTTQYKSASIQGEMRKYWLISFSFFFITSVVFVPIALAQNEPAWLIADNVQASNSALKQYLYNNYSIQKVDLQIVKDTYGHQRKYLHIKGDLTPKETVTPNKGEPGRTRAIAQTFIEKEAGPLFGVTNLSDIREFEIVTDLMGWSHWPYVRYRQYVGDLPLYGSLIQVKIGSNENISAVDAYLEPIPPELLQVVGRKTLAEDEIRKIVVDDITATTQSFKTVIINLEKFATASPPYVIWKANTVWDYTIDAFTGKILKRLPEQAPANNGGTGQIEQKQTTFNDKVKQIDLKSVNLDESDGNTDEKTTDDMKMPKSNLNK